jgi:uncharacterized protein (DUF1800 family)
MSQPIPKPSSPNTLKHRGFKGALPLCGSGRIWSKVPRDGFVAWNGHRRERPALLACLGILIAGLLCGAAPAPDLLLLDRVTWGASTSSAARLLAMGTEKWLDWQLHPTAADVLPAAAQVQIDALTISQRPMADLVVEMAAQNRAANQMQDPDQKQAAQRAYQQGMSDLAKQAAEREVLRDLYSPAQLQEQMTWFWFNHFNVHQYKADIRPMLGDYEDRALRPHALGHFRDLLTATAMHPAMLRYLDNSENAAGHINENYAREIMELHTMGVGSGYTQQDVQELARILTGLGIDARPEPPRLPANLQGQLVRDGLFEFNPARHDYGDKVFLGHQIKGSGLAEVAEALDILDRQPATALHLSRELAVFFMQDAPPEPLVRRMAQTFQKTDGDIAAVLGTLFHAPEFADSAGQRFKDPVHFALSAVRLAYDDKVVLNTAPVLGWLNRMAEGLYNHETPDGYPVGSASWNGPGQMALRFEIARQIGSGSSGLFRPDEPGSADHPAFPVLQNALYFNRLRDQLSTTTRSALDQATSPQDWNTLFLSSPEFMY